jgi:hypothetical protein
MNDEVRWRRRAGLALGVYAVLEIGLTLADFAPDALRLALLVAVCVAGAGLLRDSLDHASTPWAPPPAPSIVPPGSDARLAAYVRLIENMQTARAPDGTLRDRLVRLSDQQLADQLSGPPRRLSLDEIDDYLRRIEER